MKKMQIKRFLPVSAMAGVIAVCLIATGANGATLRYDENNGDGNWETVSNWETNGVAYGSLPGAGDKALLRDVKTKGLGYVKITSDVGTVNLLELHNDVALTLDGGTLATVGTSAQNWRRNLELTLTNSASLSLTHYVRLLNDHTWTLDNSTFTTTRTLEDHSGSDTITIRNGSTYSVAEHRMRGDGETTTYIIEGAGNAVTVSNNALYSATQLNPAANWNFVMDGTDQALSTYEFGILDLLAAVNGLQSLSVDVSAWNGVSSNFTLFSGIATNALLTGTFDSVGITGGDAYVTYDYSNAVINLTMGEQLGTTVSVEVPDEDAAEEGSDPGTIRIVRDDTSGDLDVLYTLGGTADTNDYAVTHTSPVTIPDGSSFVDVVFTPVDDTLAEGNGGETISLTIASDPAYNVGAPSQGIITIAENDLTIVTTAMAGNWTNTATWAPGIVPGAGQTAAIKHAVVIDSDVGTIDLLDLGNVIASLSMSDGTLNVSGTATKNVSGGFFDLVNSSLTSAQSYRLVGHVEVTLDNSIFSVDDLQDWNGTDTITVSNASTFSVGTKYNMSANGSTNDFIIAGAGNSVSVNEHALQSGDNAPVVNWTFVLDDTDDALSTYNYGTLDLLAATNGTQDLIVDISAWNGVNSSLALFSGIDTNSTLTGEFDNVTILGGIGGETVTYDYTDGGAITLNLTGGIITTNGVSVSLAGGDLAIDTISNATYIVESKLSLVTDPWTVYTNIVGDGSTITIPMSTDEDAEFYRALEAK